MCAAASGIVAARDVHFCSSELMFLSTSFVLVIIVATMGTKNSTPVLVHVKQQLYCVSMLALHPQACWQTKGQRREGWRPGVTSNYWGEEGRFHVCTHAQTHTRTRSIFPYLSHTRTHLSCQKFKPLYLPVSIKSTSSYTSIHFTLPLSACADGPFFAKINISYDRSWRRIFF